MLDSGGVVVSYKRSNTDRRSLLTEAIAVLGGPQCPVAVLRKALLKLFALWCKRLELELEASRRQVPTLVKSCSLLIAWQNRKFAAILALTSVSTDTWANCDDFTRAHPKGWPRLST